MLSSELQYIVELGTGGQGLLPVPNTDLNNQIVIAARLQILPGFQVKPGPMHHYM
jgi:hypothetical protein